MSVPAVIKSEIISSHLAFKLVHPFFRLDVEEFWAVALNSKKQVINSAMLFRGTVDHCMVHPRDIFRFGILENASSMLVAHNHPSGDCLPSIEDIQLTRKIEKAGLLLQVPLIDHIIVNADSYFSFADARHLG